MSESDTNLDDPAAPDDQQEDASDFIQDLRIAETQAVLAATDWTTQTVLIQLTKGNIELNPDFQRRDAWRIARKSRFIESLILGIPIPQLVLAERKNKRNSFLVIDGKQRLLALRQFCADADDTVYRRFPLRELNIRSDLNGKYYSDILTDEGNSQDITNFENGAIRTVVIRNWPNEKFLYQVFLRLNTGSVPLSPQELRQALHPGPFSSFVDTFSGSSREIRGILGLSAPDFRMRDAELVIRYFAFRNYIHDYKGNLAPLLDITTERFNSIWEGGDEALIKSQADDLLASISFTMEVFGTDAFRKWNGRSFEKFLNRAVFDVMVLFFDKEQTRTSAKSKAAEVKRSFQMLCDRDPEFRSSIEGTTKSIDAIYTRLSHWRNKLQEIVGANNVRPLSLANGKIVI
jgi:hypothetical protein